MRYTLLGLGLMAMFVGAIVTLTANSLDAATRLVSMLVVVCGAVWFAAGGIIGAIEALRTPAPMPPQPQWQQPMQRPPMQ